MSAQSQTPRAQAEFDASYPALVSAVDELCPTLPWCITGVSALLYDEIGLWFELTKPKNWATRRDGTIEVGLGAIGGSLEAGETLADCWQRELLEEIGVPATREAVAETVVVYQEREVCRVPSQDEGAPCPTLLTVSANRYRRARLPGCATLAIVTWWGRLTESPRLGDVYGLVRIPWESAAAALQPAEQSLATLVGLPGATIQQNAPLPACAVVRPVWTVRSVQLALAQGALDLSTPR